MNIIREDVDALNAVIKVEVSPADYKDKVKDTLDKYRKTAELRCLLKFPFFRKSFFSMMK